MRWRCALVRSSRFIGQPSIFVRIANDLIILCEKGRPAWLGDTESEGQCRIPSIAIETLGAGAELLLPERF